MVLMLAGMTGGLHWPSPLAGLAVATFGAGHEAHTGLLVEKEY